MSAKPEITIPVPLRDLAALHKLSSRAIATGDAIDALYVKAAVRRVLQPGLDALDAIDPAITVKFWHEHCTSRDATTGSQGRGTRAGRGATVG